MNAPAPFPARRRALDPRSLATLALLALAACGGGGNDPPPAPTGGQLQGTLGVLLGDSTTLEAEPNDTVEQAHVLGNLLPGQTRTVLGTITDNGSDDFDGFLLIAPERVRIDITLAGISTSSDLDVLVYDPISLQAVERFETNSSSEFGSFVAQGSFFVVVDAFSGTSDYQLTLAATAIPQAGSLEIEPNDSLATGNYLGSIEPGASAVVRGDGTIPNSDFFLCAIPEALDLRVECSFGAGEDYDLYVYDVTQGFGSPVLRGAFESTGNPEVGVVSGMLAMTLVAVEVRPFGGASSPYTLRIEGISPLAGVLGALGGPASPAAQDLAPLRLSQLPRASLDEARARHRGPLPARLFTEPMAEMFTGDLIVEMAGAPPAQAPGGSAGAAGIAPEPVDELVRRTGGAVEARVPGGPSRARFALPAGLDEAEAARYTLALAATLRGRTGVTLAEPDYRLRAFAAPQAEVRPDDQYYNLQWHYEQIQLPAAWAITTGSNAVRVAVLDTGSAPSMDLLPRNVAGIDMISDPGIAGDGNGIDNDPTDVGDSMGFQPSSFHGAHVAGTIGAVTDNAYGVSGVTWQTQIMHVRVLGIGGGSTFDILNAVLYAAGLPNQSNQTPAQPAQIQNLSLGGPGFSQAFQNAINSARGAGSLVIAAAGNENSSTPSYPAAYANVISVAAVDFERRRAPYSNFHASVDIAAPGGDVSADRNGDGYADGVLSTKPDDTVNPTNFENYSFYQGTSMAAPHVAGVAALVLSLNLAQTPADIEAVLASTATDLGAPGRDDQFGEGLVNALAAVQAAGGGGMGAPSLSLQQTTTLFEQRTGTRRVGVANSGGGTLTVGSITSGTSGGGSWLSASSVAGAPGGTTNTIAIDVTVDATGLADGVYGGTVTVQSNGGTQVLAVTLALGTGGQAPVYEVFVLAVDVETFATIDQFSVFTDGSLSYRLDGLGSGEYLIVAGTDENNDGFICDPGEPLCGVYPSLEFAETIPLGQSEVRSGLDFPLEQTALPASTGQGFALLHAGGR